MTVESNSTINSLSGFGTNFGSKEARLALAIAAAGIGGGGGGGGVPIVASRITYEVSNAFSGATLGQQVSCTKIYKENGDLVDEVWVNDSTNLILGTPNIADLIALEDLTLNLTRSINTGLNNLRDINKPNVLGTRRVFSVVNNSPVITSNVGAVISSLYICNPTETTAHYIGICDTNVAPVNGTNQELAFWNPGTANFQMLIDKNTFSEVNLSGFTITRSSTFNVYTQLATPLATPSIIQLTSRS
jgi:hypothetical protein